MSGRFRCQLPRRLGSSGRCRCRPGRGRLGGDAELTLLGPPAADAPEPDPELELPLPPKGLNPFPEPKAPPLDCGVRGAGPPDAVAQSQAHQHRNDQQQRRDGTRQGAAGSRRLGGAPGIGPPALSPAAGRAAPGAAAVGAATVLPAAVGPAGLLRRRRRTVPPGQLLPAAPAAAVRVSSLGPPRWAGTGWPGPGR